METVGGLPFDRRLVLHRPPRGGWIVLTYRTDPFARPLRPAVRFLRTDGSREEFVMPGVLLGAAHWLGRIPPGLIEIRVAAEPGFVLERVGLRSEASLLAECALKSPQRLVPALYTRLRGDERKHRNILRAACAITPFAAYAAWRASRCRTPEASDPAASLSIQLTLSAGRGDERHLAQTVASLTAQTHGAWRLHVFVVDDGTSLLSEQRDARVTFSRCDRMQADPIGDGDAIGFLQPGDRLKPDALAILAAALAEADAPDLVYSDDETSHGYPRLKPDWSPDLARSTGYTGTPTLLSRAFVERLRRQRAASRDTQTSAPAAPTAQVAAAIHDAPEAPSLDTLTTAKDILLSSAALAESATHIPRVLCSTRVANPGPTEDDRRVSPVGLTAHQVTPNPNWPVPDPAPLVSVIIPSRDRPDLIGRITRDVLDRTEYAAVELVIVDNGSTDAAVLDLYGQLRENPRVRIVPFPQPFDFAAMVNAGAAAARGDVLVFLNNDIAVTRPDWLSALVGQAIRPDIGAVGAKLLYGDGQLQHAGVVIGIGGGSGHILRRKPGDTAGRLGQLRVAHEVSAVTAACLAIERRKFEAVGGFDQTAFPIDFNDADLCLRIAAKGWRTIWTPQASLLHLESISRGPPTGAARGRFEREMAMFAERWRDVIRHDPYHHPALTLTRFDEALE